MGRPKGSKNIPRDVSSEAVEESSEVSSSKSDRAPRNHSPKGPTWKEAAAVEKTLCGTIETLGLGVGIINKIDGEIIESGAPALAKALVDLASVDPRYRKFIVSASAPGKYGPLLMAIGGIGLPIMKNHANIALEKKASTADITSAPVEEIIREAHVDSPIQDTPSVPYEERITPQDSATINAEVTELPSGFVIPESL